jgi:hypothetical protein
MDINDFVGPVPSPGDYFNRLLCFLEAWPLRLDDELLIPSFSTAGATELLYPLDKKYFIKFAIHNEAGEDMPKTEQRIHFVARFARRKEFWLTPTAPAIPVIDLPRTAAGGQNAACFAPPKR